MWNPATRLPDGMFSYQTPFPWQLQYTILVYFGRPWIVKFCHLVCPLGILCGHWFFMNTYIHRYLVHLWWFVKLSHFGTLNQEKSGNPSRDSCES
jgi:hypothetical protein